MGFGHGALSGCWKNQKDFELPAALDDVLRQAKAHYLRTAAPISRQTGC